MRDSGTLYGQTAATVGEAWWRGHAGWRWAAAILGVMTLLLAGLLVRAESTAPTHAADIYNLWANRMTAMRIVPAGTVAFAEQATTSNAQAQGMLDGYRLGRQDLPQDVGLMTSYLWTINDYLNRLIQGYWSDGSKKRVADALRLQHLVRHTLFANLPTQQVKGITPIPAQVHSDSDAVRLNRRLCTIGAQIARAWYRAYVTGGLAAANDAQMRSACAGGQAFP